MLEKLVIIVLVILLIPLITFCVKMINKKVEEKKMEVGMNCQQEWEAFVEDLPARIAGLPDTNAMKEKAGEDVTVAQIEEALGTRPSHWRRFAELVLAKEQPPLSEVIGFMRCVNSRTEQELKSWCKMYLLWNFGWGRGKVITPRDWWDLSDVDIAILNQAVDIPRNLFAHPEDITSMVELRKAYLGARNTFSERTEQDKRDEVGDFIMGIKDKILSQKNAECQTLSDMVRMFGSENWCRCNDLWSEAPCICAEDFRYNLQERIEEIIECQISTANTIAELDAVNLYYFTNLKYAKAQKKEALIEQDKEHRIHEAIKQS